MEQLMIAKPNLNIEYHASGFSRDIRKYMETDNSNKTLLIYISCEIILEIKYRDEQFCPFKCLWRQEKYHMFV